MKRKHKKRFINSPIWYWGISELYGKVFSTKRSEHCPHLCISSSIILFKGYCGWDPERNRFIVRPLDDKGMRNIGWRKEVYGK